MKMNKALSSRRGAVGTLIFIMTGILVSILVFALLPLLLRQTSFSAGFALSPSALLIPLEKEDVFEPILEQADPLPDPPEPPEPEPEPEIEPEPPELAEIKPPEIEMPEVQPPEMELEPIDTNPLPEVDLKMNTPSISTASLNSLPIRSSPMNLKVNLKPGRAGLPRALARPVPKPRAAVKPPPPKTRFNMDEVDRKPVSVSAMQPVYPYRARRMAIEGFVDVKFLVDRDGKTRDVTILKAKPDGVFEKSVKSALTRWRFNPAIKDGKPVETWVMTTVRFVLSKDS